MTTNHRERISSRQRLGLRQSSGAFSATSKSARGLAQSKTWRIFQTTHDRLYEDPVSHAPIGTRKSASTDYLMKLASFSFVICLLRQCAIKFRMASRLRILLTSVGLLCWMDAQAQQMPQDTWIYSGIFMRGNFRSLAVGPDDQIYAGTTTNTVCVFGSDGHLIRVFGSFGGISGIGLDSRINVYVLDSGNQMIKKFTPLGTSLSTWGGAGTNTGQMLTGGSFGQRVGTGCTMLAIDRASERSSPVAVPRRQRAATFFSSV